MKPITWIKIPMGKRWLWLFIFGMAMGLLEAAVVVYLRQLYYPHGFDFPMTSIPVHILGVELCREIATIVMLLSLAWIAGYTTVQRLAWFLYSFAIWDLSYYLFLYVFLGWPSSLFTWDLLFLLPIAWTSPVLAPVLVSLTFILLAWGMLVVESDGTRPLPLLSWLLLACGAVVLIFSFLYDYASFMLQYIRWSDFWNSAKTDMVMYYSTQYIPRSYNWFLFVIGELMLLGSLFVYRLRR